jgi:aminobenzoyl-glutamate utilization protein B
MAGAVAVRYAMEAEGIKGTVKFFGCPAEETLVGKVFMVRDGVFDGLDAVLSHHPGSTNTSGLGSTNAVNSIKFHFHGVASHAGGSPDQGRSGLDAAELMNVGVNYLREHVVQETRIHYVIEDGGHEPNVVPPYARSWYFVRAPERSEVESITQWILRIADGADLMTNTKHDVEFLTGCYNTLPNQVLSELIISNMREIGTPTYKKKDLQFAKEISKSISPEEKRRALQRSKRPDWQKLIDIEIDTSVPDPWDDGVTWPWSTDVGDVSWQAPTKGFTTATYTLGTPGHSWQNVAFSKSSVGHKSLLFASKVIACSALDLMTKPELLKRAKQEFTERMKSATYISPISPDLKPPFNQLPSIKV